MVRTGIGVSGASALAALGVWITACTDGTRVSEHSNASGPSLSSGIDAGGGGNDPRIVRVLLAATAGPSAGTAGRAGAAGAAGKAAAGTAGAAGTALGVAGNAGAPSVYCGDGKRDVLKEECDDGSGSPGAFCNWACQLEDNWAAHTAVVAPAGSHRTLHELGRGRHPVAANGNRFAVAVIEQVTPGEQAVEVVQYDDIGVPIGSSEMSLGTWVADQPDPVVAVLNNGDVLMAFTEFGGDGDGLGIATRRLRAGQTKPDAVTWASVPNFAAQYDPDILALSDRIILAYTDEFDAVTGPDITLRELNLDLTQKSSMSLADTGDVEGRVALAKLGDSWGAAWRRELADGTETVDVYDAASGTRWSIGPHSASDADDQPALMSLDATRRLVLYVRDAAPPGNQIAMTGQLYLAVVDTAHPGSPISDNPVAITNNYVNYSSLSQRRPALQTLGSDAYMAWSTGPRTNNPAFGNGEEVWYQRVSPAISSTPSSTPTFGLNGEQTIPRWTSELLGDQRAPALALLGPSANQPGGALISAWEDYGETLGTESAEPEVIVQMAPLPLLRTSTTRATDCTVTVPCGPGKGRCTSDDQCISPLICSPKNGPNFSFAPNVGVCVPTHCADGVLDNGETLVDCGGTGAAPDCGTCLCGDGIVSPEFGEVCDTAGNSATCDKDCTLPACGDGLVNSAAGEQCDLGAGNGPNAACLSNCTLPPSCTNAPNCFGAWSKQGASSSN
jgi:cysteine-rich repeat protein